MTTPDATPEPSRLGALLKRSAAALLLALAGGLLAGFVFNRVLDQAIAARTETNAFALLARVGPEVEAVLAAKQDPKDTIERLGRQVSLRATLIGTDGRVLGDSSVERSRIDTLENHAGRPEVQEALRRGSGVWRRYSATVADRLVYAAVRLRGGEVLRLALPEGNLSEWAAPYRRRTLGYSILAGLLVAALLVRVRSRHTAELVLVRQAVAIVEKGERPANPGPVSEETAAVFSVLGDLADFASERAAEARRHAVVSRAVFDEVPVGLLVVDSRLSLLDANAEAVRLLGAEPGTMRPGEHVLELVRERSITDLLEAALEEGRATATLRIAPERIGHSLDATAVRVAEGAMTGHPAAVAILRETPSPRPV